MEETILFPSPNWFQASGLAVSQDGWIIYGGPTKSLCVLEPVLTEQDGILLGKHNFKTHVLNRAHPDKIVCVAISPEWPVKRDILSGSVDGLVKQWSLDQVDNNWRLKATQSHDKHHHEKEEVAGVAYSHDSYAVTVGSFGNLIKWDIKSNVVKTFRCLKSFKPTCIACSPHIPLHVAVGTKQGVVFVVDLTGAGKIIYKVRGQDDEITNVNWCPQFEVLVKKSLGEPDKKEKVSVATQRMMKIRQLTDEEKQQLSDGEKAEEKTEETVESKDKIEEVKLVSEKGQQQLSDGEKADEKTEETVESKDKIEKEKLVSEKGQEKNVLEDSGIIKSLPEDSFDETVVPEDDMFDIYKDHEADEFGHKKYQPEEIVVKIKEDVESADYLAECLKLKEEILKRKNQEEQTMESLVKALDDAHLDKTKDLPSTSSTEATGEALSVEDNKTESDAQIVQEVDGKKADCSVHVHKHLLATVSKFGSVRIWSKSGKLVGSCAVPTLGNKNVRTKSPAWATILWYKSDVLLIADGKSQLLLSNPLKVDSKNKLEWQIVHSLHKRGLFCIASDAPRVQSADQSYDEFTVWTASQERYMFGYSLAKKQKLASIAGCGAYVYNIQACPYDAGKVAISVGDGAVRVWETETSEDERRLSPGNVATYWQYVQGKVLCVAWHPTGENLLAFSTAESRIGLIDTSSKSDKGTRNLLSALNAGVYSLCWGEGNDLYACGGGNLVVYKTNKVDEAPAPITVGWEGQPWELSAVVWREDALLVGSMAGAVALLTPTYPHTVVSATFVFSKMIHMMDWHPQQTSNGLGDSPHKNLIAVCSLDKQNTIVILEYVEKEDGVKHLNSWKTLSGHKGPVHQVYWSPHDDELLLSTSRDATVRVWNVESGVNTHIFGGHAGGTISACWIPHPTLAGAVLSGGSDASVRLWHHHHHPAARHQEVTQETKKKKKDKKPANKPEETNEEDRDESAVAATQDSKIKASKKFLLPVLTKQMSPCSIQGVRKMLTKYLEKKNGEAASVVEEDMEQSYNVNYIKIFGSIKEVNEVLDEELERHEDTGKFEAWIMLSIFRGHIDTMIQFASQRDMLSPYLLNMAPCVSLKYWKDVSQLYLAQIDRLVAKGEEHKLTENCSYGGAVFRKTATLLSVHDVKAAVAALADAALYKEAYILCRTRYMDSIAEEILHRWAEDCSKSGMFNMAAVCHVALGNLADAANILSKSKDENWLSLAAEMAKIVGQTTFADHISEKREQIKNNAASESVQEEMDQLPSRIELLMKETSKGDAKGQGVSDEEKNATIEDVGIEKRQGDMDGAKGDVIREHNLKEGGQGDMKEGGQGDMKEGQGNMKEGGQGDMKEGGQGDMKEGGQGDMKEGGQGDMKEGQGDMKDCAFKDAVMETGDLDSVLKEENGDEKGVVLNGKHEVVNE